MLNNQSLDEKDICASAGRVGRKLRYPEKKEGAFREGTLARIRKALRGDENQVGFIRAAVEERLAARGYAMPPEED